MRQEARVLPGMEDRNINVADIVHPINRARSRPEKAQETPVHAAVIPFVLLDRVEGTVIYQTHGGHLIIRNERRIHHALFNHIRLNSV